jgi:hypothetical protein
VDRDILFNSRFFTSFFKKGLTGKPFEKMLDPTFTAESLTKGLI